jgi:hypothetical protein
MNKITWMAVLLVAFSGQALGASTNFCGDLKASFGPFDYRTPEDAPSREMVTSAHFTDDVAAGIKGNTGTIGADLDYTLKAIPNHPGALATMGNVALAKKNNDVGWREVPSRMLFRTRDAFSAE